MQLNHVIDSFALLMLGLIKIRVRICVEFSEFVHVAIKYKLKNMRK